MTIRKGGYKMSRLAGIDIGNDSIKIALEDQKDPIIIPNVVALGYERLILQEEDSAIKALDVVINSPSLAKSNQRYFVGLLAMEDEDNFELEETDNKAESDQSLIVMLTSLAYAGAINQTSGNSNYDTTSDFEYVIGTGLPVRTYSRFHKSFEERLVGEHEVTFLSTPKLHNKKVRVIIRKAFMSIEGAAALYNMATNDSLEIKDEELYNGCIGICEIGALTTDFPVVRRMNIDNRFSYGEQMGLATYLDSIIRDVEDHFGYSFPSRTKLVQRIKTRNFFVQQIGEGQSDIKPIVDHYFNRAAERIVDMIKKRWKKYPDIQCFYVIGGGGAALKPYIINAAGSMTLRFVEDSELQNVYGYLKIARSQLNRVHQP